MAGPVAKYMYMYISRPEVYSILYNIRSNHGKVRHSMMQEGMKKHVTKMQAT